MLAYNFFLTVMGVLILTVSTMAYIPIDNLGQTIVDQLRDVLPSDALSLVDRTLVMSMVAAGGPRWRFLTPGTLLAAGAWLLSTLAFGFYVDRFGTYESVYGTLSAVVVLLPGCGSAPSSC